MTVELRMIRGHRLGAVDATPRLPIPPAWTVDAVCAQTDPEAFFPEKGGSTRAAKQICAGCPVRAECLAWALENGERVGIWGGTSYRERRRLHRQQQRQETAGEAAA
ncbi:WhiB family transcriptional regulator [Haloechinothrix salitolerans]|uniref:Transcriptional regulator WhiB n=1 Tax=Haloechinothrix salitolerans TaxID=926830 RepID=A0ABW2C0D2_9PSEU